jgi:C4-dicarboxylate transporter DctM subunit
MGTIVPPSFPMVIYGLTNNVSVGDLFIAGFGPAFVVGAALMIVNYIFSKKHGYKGSNKVNLKEIKDSVLDGLPALFMPVIILGGIYGGVFTVTEASVVSVVYGILVGVFWYKEISLKETFKLYRENAIFLGAVMLTIAPCAGLSRVFSYRGLQMPLPLSLST